MSSLARGVMGQKILDWPRSRKQVTVVFLDAFLAIFSMWLSFTLRLDVFHRPVGAEWIAYTTSPLIAIPIFIKLGLYRAIFRYTGVAAILATGKAVSAYGLVLAPIIWFLFHWEGVPRSLIVLQPLIFLLLISASRTLGWHWLQGGTAKRESRLLIFGAGSAGAQTAAALAGTRQYALLGFIDDDISKCGRTINGVLVFSAIEVKEITERLKVTDILLALPSATRQRRNQIIGQLQSLPVRVRSLPGLSDLASGRISIEDFQELDIEDLLGREPVSASSRVKLPVMDFSEHAVLITGAGGSIGSELCRQIVFHCPKKIVIIDHSEFALYQIHRELDSLVARSGRKIELVPILANVCDFERISAVFRAHAPATVYHAAAYKHVPMVEGNPSAGIINNVLGTLNTVRAAVAHGVESFVLISTDKAVRPTNVMGASKRIAEMILQSVAAADSHPFRDEGETYADASLGKTRFSMVRFGNVLGSSGSVVPLFRSQIAGGGPITVTHPDVTRYFMTIPEAVQLVLHAGAMAEGGDLFVLDMGEPVKILDLAERMVALSGRTVRSDARPTGDIAITFTGLRPGEKLYEELLIGENPLPTQHPRIIRAREDFMEWPALKLHLRNLLQAARSDNISMMKDALRTLVPGYVPEGVPIE